MNRGAMVYSAPQQVHDKLFVTGAGLRADAQQFFTESLILAQDERWRRA